MHMRTTNVIMKPFIMRKAIIWEGTITMLSSVSRILNMLKKV